MTGATQKILFPILIGCLLATVSACGGSGSAPGPTTVSAACSSGCRIAIDKIFTTCVYRPDEIPGWFQACTATYAVYPDLMAECVECLSSSSCEALDDACRESCREFNGEMAGSHPTGQDLCGYLEMDCSGACDLWENCVGAEAGSGIDCVAACLQDPYLNSACIQATACRADEMIDCLDGAG